MTQLFLLLLLCVISVIVEGLSTSAKHTDASCDLFLAPSPVGGWGVFANRSFRRNEIVEIAPLFLTVGLSDEGLHVTVLGDYFYGLELHPGQNRAVISFGFTFFYNHHPNPNVKWSSFWPTPSSGSEEVLQIHSRAVGFVAVRDISKGEELFSSYGEADSGEAWFKARGIQLSSWTTTTQNRHDGEHKFCSHVHSGMGQSGWARVQEPFVALGHEFPYALDASKRLSPNDHPTAIAKTTIREGTLLEMAPALTVASPKIRNSVLAPFSIFWEDLTIEQQASLQKLREVGALTLRESPEFSSSLERRDVLDKYGLENVALLPIGGNIGMVQRSSKHHAADDFANCRLEFAAATASYEKAAIKDDDEHVGNAGIVLQLIASRTIEAGEELIMNVPITATGPARLMELGLLFEELDTSGQIIPKWLLNQLQLEEELVILQAEADGYEL